MSGRNLRQRAREARLTWDPVEGGRIGPVCFLDEKLYDLGEDADGSRYAEITKRMLSGHYYPPDVLTIEGDFQHEAREIRAGDRLIQISRPIPFGPQLATVTEVFIANRGVAETRFGYVTTNLHYARGIWEARLTRVDGRLKLHVRGTVCPSSFLFWIGLPIARYIQKRAWRRAYETFLKMNNFQVL